MAVASLLDGYAFADHASAFDSAAELKRAVAFYSSRRMAIQRVVLTLDWAEPLVDSQTGQPLLPASLLALSVGHVPDPREGWTKRTLAAYVAFDGSWPGKDARTAENGDHCSDGDAEFYRRIDSGSGSSDGGG